MSLNFYYTVAKDIIKLMTYFLIFKYISSVYLGNKKHIQKKALKIIKMFHLRLNKPLRDVRLEALTHSPQAFSVSHSGAGLGWGFSRATPPVSRKRHTSSSTRPLQGRSLT